MSESVNVVELEAKYLLQNYARHPIVITRGDGPYMWDVNGKRYLDFIAGIGVNALGQNHPRIVKAIQEQAAKLIHTSNLFYNEYQDRWRSALRRPAVSNGRFSPTAAPSRWKAR